jgi:hypothetical protein
MNETITIIRARGGKRLAKVIRADGSLAAYDAAYCFDLIVRPVQDLSALGKLLQQLMHRQDCAVVRGAVANPMRTINVRRLAYRDPHTGDEPTLADVAHSWVALDMEGIERPQDVPPADLERCAAEAIRKLPAPFHGARCIAQATASHGIKPGCRVRLWYWLTRPTTGAELTGWLRGKPADPSVFRTAQPIYTAAPIFESGVRDQLPRRMVLLPGTDLVAVPPASGVGSLPPQPRSSLPPAADLRVARYAFAALINAATRIQQAGIGDRHRTILSEARGLARFIASGLLTERDVTAVLHGAGEAAGKPEREIASIIAWAIAHPAVVPSAENLPR